MSGWWNLFVCCYRFDNWETDFMIEDELDIIFLSCSVVKVRPALSAAAKVTMKSKEPGAWMRK